MITNGRIRRLLVAAPVTALAAFALARGSAAPIVTRGGNVARLRLSWSARPERIESCHTLSAAELAQREEHMRQRVMCDGHFATYQLDVSADDHPLHASVVQGAGLRHDRPIYLLRDFDMEAGTHRVRISFVRREHTDGDAAAFASVTQTGVDTGIFAGRAQREAAEHARRAGAAIPPQLAIDTTITLVAGRVMVVTFDQETRRLLLLEETATRAVGARTPPRPSSARDSPSGATRPASPNGALRHHERNF